MDGTLFVYSKQHRLVAFRSRGTPPGSGHPAEWHRTPVCVFLGGLSDGLLFADFAPTLADAIGHHGWSLVQPLLRSSASGWGTSSLKTDAEDLDELLKHLHDDGCPTVVLFGHSTGCQDAVYHLKHGAWSELVCGVVLQAPVSDREYFATLPDTQSKSDAAHALVAAGRGHDVLPRADSNSVPVSASRWLSLAGPDGDDDMFSSDFSDAELKEKLGHINIPVLLVQSSADEYIPRDIDGAKLVHRLANAIGPQARAVVLDGAKHVPEGDHAEKHVDVVRAFIAGMQCSRSRDDSKE